MPEKYIAETASDSTAVTTMKTPGLIDESLKTYLLYGSWAAVLVLIIVLIARECSHRRRCTSKSKTDSDEYPLAPAGRYSSTASTESHAPNQRDHVESVLSDDISSVPTDPRVRDRPLDRDEPMDRDLDDQPAQSSDAQPTINTSLAAAPMAKAATLHPGRFQGLWKHPEFPKVVTLKPVVAKKNKNAKKAGDVENNCGGYVEADRRRNLVIEPEESDIDDEGFYMNAQQPTGARREGREIGRRPEDDNDKMYVNTLTMTNRKR